MGDAAAEEKAALDDAKLRCWKESVAKELKVQIVAAPFRASYAPNDARSWAAPEAPHRHDPSAPFAAPDPTSPYGAHYAAFAAARTAPRRRYLFPATPAQEIGWLRRRAGPGGAAVQQGGLLRGASYGRRHGDIVTAAAEAAKSPAVGRPAPAAGAQTWHP